MTPLAPWLATSAIQMPRIETPADFTRSWISAQSGSYSSWLLVRVSPGYLSSCGYLGEPLRMRADYGHVADLWARVVMWDVLLNGEVEYLLLFVRGGARIASDVLTRNDMLLDEEWKFRHVERDD